MELTGLKGKRTRVNLRFSDDDIILIEQANLKYSSETGKKPILSRVIIYALKRFTGLG